MSGDGGVDIDLYADVEQDFPQEDFSNENNDLYDDVITASTSKDDEKETKAVVKKEEQERGDSQSSGSSRQEGRRWRRKEANTRRAPLHSFCRKSPQQHCSRGHRRYV